ncbi:MAG: hypothetical protein JXA44_00960 [Methanospirillaceae archaeon]|nr:hypothetical protein [Methanospirillaceae archaeon]
MSLKQSRLVMGGTLLILSFVCNADKQSHYFEGYGSYPAYHQTLPDSDTRMIP